MIMKSLAALVQIKQIFRKYFCSKTYVYSLESPQPDGSKEHARDIFSAKKKKKLFLISHLKYHLSYLQIRFFFLFFFFNPKVLISPITYVVGTH